MSNDVAKDKEHRKQDSVLDHAAKVFEKSSVCAVATILSTETKPRRIIRSVIFGLFTFVFFYQFFGFLHYVLQYPTIVDFESIRPESYASPAYTFCNNNMLKRSKFCEKYPRNCTKPRRDFCDENPRFCGTPDTQILKSDIYEVASERELYEFNHGAEDMINFDETDEDRPIGPIPRTNRYEGTIAACFSVFGRVDSPLDPYMASKTPIGMGLAKFFHFDPQENELIYPEAKAGIMFDVHSPFEPSNPFETGIFLRPGYLYRIQVKMTQEELLPYDCTNYTEVWLNNDKTGYRSQKSCIHKCIGDEVLKCYNCSEPTVLYPYPKAAMCYPDDMELKSKCKNIADRAKECITGCKDDCLKLRYSYKVQENYMNKVAHKIERNDSREIRVVIEFRDLDIQKIVHKPQFLVLEIFSLIGGLLAFWIGLSLFQITEVFDGIYQTAKNIKNRQMCSESSSA